MVIGNVNEAKVKFCVDKYNQTVTTVAILGELDPEVDPVFKQIPEENFLNFSKGILKNENFKEDLCCGCSLNYLVCRSCIANEHCLDEEPENCPIDAIIIVINGKKSEVRALIPKKL